MSKCELFDPNDEQCKLCEQDGECLEACWRGWNSYFNDSDVYFEDYDLGAM